MVDPQMVRFAPQQLPPDEMQEALAIERRRRLAQELRMRGAQGIDPTRTAGRFVIPVQPLELLNQAGQTFAGAALERKADDDARAMGARRAEALRNWTADMPQDRQVSTSLPDDQAGPQAGPVNQPASRQQLLAWAMRGRNIDPQLSQTVASKALDGMIRENKPMVVGRSMMDQSGNVLAVDPTIATERDERNAARRDELEFRAAQRQHELLVLHQQKMEALQAQNASREQMVAAQREFQAALANEQMRHHADMIRLAASLRPAPQPPAPQIITNAEGTFALGRDGQAVPVMNPTTGQPMMGKQTPEKALPTSAAEKLFENQQNLRRAEEALALNSGQNVGDMQGDASATGWKGMVPDFALQRLDPKGVEARAAIGDLGSLIIHDRSGAAVTAAEFPRLRPFIPLKTDDQATVQKKLSRFVNEYRKINQEMSDFYESSGYKVPRETLQPSGAPAAGARGARPAPGGFRVLGRE